MLVTNLGASSNLDHRQESDVNPPLPIRKGGGGGARGFLSGGGRQLRFNLREAGGESGGLVREWHHMAEGANSTTLTRGAEGLFQEVGSCRRATLSFPAG